MKQYLLLEASGSEAHEEGGFFQFIVCSKTFSVIESYYISSKEAILEPMKIDLTQFKEQLFTLKQIKLDPLASIDEMLRELRPHIQTNPQSIDDNFFKPSNLRFQIADTRMLKFCNSSGI